MKRISKIAALAAAVCLALTGCSNGISEHGTMNESVPETQSNNSGNETESKDEIIKEILDEAGSDIVSETVNNSSSDKNGKTQATTSQSTAAKTTATTLQSSVAEKISEVETPLSETDKMAQEFSDFIDQQLYNIENEIQPIFGSGDLFLTVGDYEIYIQKEESYSGDTTSLGVYNTKEEKWIIPYTTESEFLSVVDIDEFMDKRKVGTNWLSGNSGSHINYEGGTVISCRDYVSSFYNFKWYFDFASNKFLYIRDPSIYLYHTDENLVVYYDERELISFNWDTGEQQTIIGGEILAILQDSILIKMNGDDNYKLIDYQGNILIDLSEYKMFRNITTQNIAYNGNKLLATVKGKESSIYACLINNDGSLAFDPIQVYDPGSGASKNLLYLFDDFFVIVRKDEDDENQGVFFYDFSGKELCWRVLDIYSNVDNLYNAA